jgi:hypothetical protein
MGFDPLPKVELGGKYHRSPEDVETWTYELDRRTVIRYADGSLAFIDEDGTYGVFGFESPVARMDAMLRHLDTGFPF